MDKNTLSQYGWVVIALIILIILITLATPFGNYIKNAVSASTEAMENKVKTTFTNAGINIADFPTKINGTGNDEALVPELVIDTSQPYAANAVIRKDSSILDGYDGVLYGYDIYDVIPDCEEFYSDVLNVTNGGSIVVRDSIVYPGQYGTGSVIEVYDSNNNLSSKYISVIFGDVDGDGSITSLDANIVSDHDAWLVFIDENSVEFIAADANGDNCVETTDVPTIEREELSYDSINQREVGDLHFGF